ncbi:flavin-containing amine oxidase [Penicillium alfredii]|uniref:Amine oxidase n=1 Tax=Penicillium alfredii TaxID=1506179 RepID=A0A9W9JU05_9EURO|nr:flavin-containing amine oxidase [Penicillium alfredii]KAJ5081570.1 flavin-containing amine oxidase [Penicillium alfredii]
MLDVVVIGAGFSGLEAAYSAQQAGLSVAVVEARDRVGGKIWSAPLASGRGYADLGGAWINDSLQPRVWAYVQKFGLGVVKQRLEGRAVMQESQEKRFEFPFGVTPDFSPEEKKNLEYIRDHIQAESLKTGLPSAQVDNVSLDQYVRDLGALPKTAQMVNLWARVMHGLESTEESAAWFIDYCRRNKGLLAIRADDSTGGQHLRFQDGAQSIATEIAKLIGAGNIHLASPVASINDYGSHVGVITRTGKTFLARKCILSVPSTMYKELNITPALPQAVQEVTNNTILGDYNKAIVCYDKPWWREQGFNGYFASYLGPVILARDTSVDERKHYSLTCFVNGLPGRQWSKLPPHERRAVVLKQVAQIFKTDTKSEVFRPIEVFDQIWQHEEFSRGALAPVTALGHLTKYASVYGRPVGNVHFVGTEYSPEWKGYMEGALCSGELGARQVVEAIQRVPAAKL